ncbi:UPF0280 family protein [Methanorbis rubei]|uniref:UPF0280 protein McpCs1_17550 n=1 Tax=Methanorbis rubei TaxID=3028300 RepID=A0AAE4SD16_9EURY|nr:hypothetical protein [Methanocorpusculaceae archaeon Cs1]
MIREHFEYRQTITTILADDQLHIEAAKAGMIAARTDLESYLCADPFFGTSYSPVPAAAGAPLIVERMADACREADVGPMAAVAAAVAWAGVESMVEAGALFGLIDNGGDIVFVADRPVRVGIYAGDAPISGKYAFVVPQVSGIRGICTSSATVGPSVSFGIADAVVVFSNNPAKADAWATSLCNTILPTAEGLAVPSEADIDAVYAVIGDWTAAWGDLPEIVPAAVRYDMITKGE